MPIPALQMAHKLADIGSTAIIFDNAEIAALNEAVAAIDVLARFPETVLAMSGTKAPPRS